MKKAANPAAFFDAQAHVRPIKMAVARTAIFVCVALRRVGYSAASWRARAFAAAVIGAASARDT